VSLNRAEVARTADELAANLERSGLTREALAAALGFTASRLDATLRVKRSSDPVDVWQLRDTLEQAVRVAGADPVPFTVLTEASRQSARQWFALRTPPPIG